MSTRVQVRPIGYSHNSLTDRYFDTFVYYCSYIYILFHLWWMVVMYILSSQKEYSAELNIVVSLFFPTKDTG